MRSPAIAALVFLATALSAQDSDPRVSWLARNAVPIRSLDVADGDFSDLEPLRGILAGVRVVMLGEHNHGDGTAFLAKTRLIRFLHEELGFDVLAFESGLYDCAKAWDFLAAGEPARVAVPRGVFGVWTSSREVQPLIDYLGTRAASDHPLELAGTDSQLTGTASEELLVRDLAAYLTSIDPKLAQGPDWNRVVQFLDYYLAGYWEMGMDSPPSAEEQAAFARTMEHWQSVIASCDRTPGTVPWSGAFWRQFLASLHDLAEQSWRTNADDRIADPANFTRRDVQMGKNLVWLAKERYPNRKIIVWAATFHNARNLRTLEVSDPKSARLYAGMIPMGEVAWKALGDQLYSLGFIAYEGEHARYFARKATPIAKPSADSLEDLSARAGLVNAWIDFRKPPAGGSWLRAPLTARLHSYQEMRADWSRIVDGVVFLRKMERSNRTP